MKLFSRILWLCVHLAVLAALMIGAARMQWEGQYRTVTLAANLGDLYKSRGVDAVESYLQGFKNIESQRPPTFTVSPQEIQEFHDQFFPSLPAEVAIPHQMLGALEEDGSLIYWKLDAWVPSDRFEAFLSALLEAHPAGLLLMAPFTLYPEYLSKLLQLLQTHSALVGVVEFATPSGMEQLHRLGYRDVVRVHTLKTEERVALSERETIGRYARAVVERNVRFLELRAITPEQIVADSTSLQREISRAGFALGPSSTPASFAPSPWILALIWLGLVSLTTLLLERLIKLSLRWMGVLWVTGLFAGLVGFFLLGELMQQSAAWLTAIIAPVAAFVFLSGRFGEGHSLQFLLTFSAFSLLGGLVAAARVSTDAYFLQIQEFPGVKVALVIPIVCIALLVLGKIEWAKLRALDVILGAVVGVVLVIVLLRSGNVPIWPVSESEVSLRSWLEELLIVRPRFKEFLIGHPLLLLWGGLGVLRWRPWAVAILLAGLLGQVSIINSFEHLHTPLWVTLLRTFHGLWLGAGLGLLLQFSLRLLLRLSPARSVD